MRKQRVHMVELPQIACGVLLIPKFFTQVYQTLLIVFVFFSISLSSFEKDGLFCVKIAPFRLKYVAWLRGFLWKKKSYFVRHVIH